MPALKNQADGESSFENHIMNVFGPESGFKVEDILDEKDYWLIYLSDGSDEYLFSLTLEKEATSSHSDGVYVFLRDTSDMAFKETGIDSGFHTNDDLIIDALKLELIQDAAHSFANHQEFPVQEFRAILQNIGLPEFDFSTYLSGTRDMKASMATKLEQDVRDAFEKRMEEKYPHIREQVKKIMQLIRKNGKGKSALTVMAKVADMTEEAIQS